MSASAAAGRLMLSGDDAVAHAVHLARAQLIPVYPITPQSPILEKLSDLAADGKLEAEIVTVESEHSAMATTMGASAAGVRVFTATASQGLFYMHELLHFASGARLPIVMVTVNRSPAAPWGFWADHTDSLSQRDTGWVKLYCETPQEALDTVIQAYRIAETAYLPVMVVFEAVYVSHTYEAVAVPTPALVDAYLPTFAAEYRLDVDRPTNFGPTVSAEQWFDHRRKLDGAMAGVTDLARQVDQEWCDRTGRGYGLVDTYRLEDAEVAIITIGGVAGTAREAVDALRAEGLKVGLVRPRLLRPVPVSDLRQALANVQQAVVIDRNCSPGLGGIVAQEVRSALYGLTGTPPVHSFIAGAGGKNIAVQDIVNMVRQALVAPVPSSHSGWYGGQ